MIQKITKITIYFMAAMIFICYSGTPASAYFDRGPISVTLGKSQTTIEQGKEESIPVSIDPSQQQQLPGCGMAECPQTCGESNCLNANGECICAGTEAQTYTAVVDVLSSNPSVASANYSNGVLKISAISSGEATITVTGKMRQYTNTSKQVKVTVTPAMSLPAAAAPTAEKPASKEEQSKKAEKTEKEEKAGKDDKEININDVDEQQKEDENKSINSERGVFEMVELKDEAMGKDALAKAIENGSNVVFQKKESGTENVLYSWTFQGDQIDKAEDLNMTIRISEQENVENTYRLDFAHDGTLPGEAAIYLCVKNMFADGEAVNLYAMEESTQEVSLLKKEIEVENGYIKFSIDHCSSYLLSSLTTLDEKETAPISGTTIGLIAAVVLILVVTCIVWMIRQKRSREIGKQS